MYFNAPIIDYLIFKYLNRKYRVLKYLFKDYLVPI